MHDSTHQDLPKKSNPVEIQQGETEEIFTDRREIKHKTKGEEVKPAKNCRRQGVRIPGKSDEWYLKINYVKKGS